MRSNGKAQGLISGLFWGLDSVVLGMALSYSVLAGLGSSGSLVTTFLHDSVSVILLLVLVLKYKKSSELLKVIKSKSGLVIMLAALLGGPLGMGGYIMSIRYLGPSLSSSISATYPIMGLLLSYLILKSNLKLHNILGLSLAVVAVILMGVSPDISVVDLRLGIFFVLLSVVGWGSEAVIIDYALRSDVSSEVALIIRQMVSALVYGLVVMPIVGFSNVSVVVSSSAVYLVILAGLLGTVSYLAYYSSIDLIGATQAMGLNISYPAWAVVFELLLLSTFSYKNSLLALVIIVGSILSNDNPREFLDVFKVRGSES